MNRQGADSKTDRFSKSAVIVAHPDDETLWAGGTILIHPETNWTVVSLCRGSDIDRSAKFFKAMEILNATGRMGDVDDSCELKELTENEIENTILGLLGNQQFDLIITHSPTGEYTSHLRHEQTANAVIKLWQQGKIIAEQLHMFAYDDAGGRLLPEAISSADRIFQLPDVIWRAKHKIITEIYGFDNDSYEARIVPHTEAFWSLRLIDQTTKKLTKIRKAKDESTCSL